MSADPLEALIRKAVRNGFLSLNLNKDWGDEDKWHVSYRNVENTTVQNFKARDPVEAMKMALRAGIRDVTGNKAEVEEIAPPTPAPEPKRRRGADLI